MNLKSQKHLFSFPEDITYLNIASQLPAAKAVEKGCKNFIRKWLLHNRM